MGARTLGFIGSRYELSSPHSTEEIYRRLKEKVGWPIFSDLSIVGLYDRRGFQLRVNIWYRNSFQTILYGTMRAEGVATHITCTARMGTFVLVFLGVWLAGLFLIGGAVALTAIDHMRDGDVSAQNMGGLAVFVLMLAFMLGLVYVGRSWAGDEETKLLAFLEEAIDATPV
jgi:hypothetical protein